MILSALLCTQAAFSSLLLRLVRAQLVQTLLSQVVSCWGSLRWRDEKESLLSQ